MHSSIPTSSVSISLPSFLSLTPFVQINPEWLKHVDFRSIPKYAEMIADANDQSIEALNFKLLHAVLENHRVKVRALITSNNSLLDLVCLYFLMGNLFFAPYLNNVTPSRFLSGTNQQNYLEDMLKKYSKQPNLLFENFEREWRGEHWQRQYGFELEAEFIEYLLQNFPNARYWEYMKNSPSVLMIRNTLGRAALIKDKKCERYKLIQRRLKVADLFESHISKAFSRVGLLDIFVLPNDKASILPEWEMVGRILHFHECKTILHFLKLQYPDNFALHVFAAQNRSKDLQQERELNSSAERVLARSRYSVANQNLRVLTTKDLKIFDSERAKVLNQYILAACASYRYAIRYQLPVGTDLLSDDLQLEELQHTFPLELRSIILSYLRKRMHFPEHSIVRREPYEEEQIKECLRDPELRRLASMPTTGEELKTPKTTAADWILNIGSSKREYSPKLIQNILSFINEDTLKDLKHKLSANRKERNKYLDYFLPAFGMHRKKVLFELLTLDEVCFEQYATLCQKVAAINQIRVCPFLVFLLQLSTNPAESGPTGLWISFQALEVGCHQENGAAIRWAIKEETIAEWKALGEGCPEEYQELKLAFKACFTLLNEFAWTPMAGVHLENSLITLRMRLDFLSRLLKNSLLLVNDSKKRHYLLSCENKLLDLGFFVRRNPAFQLANQRPSVQTGLLRRIP